MNNTVYKKCADELFARLMLGLKNPDGSLHPQSFLCCLGSLCGYACKCDVIDEYVRGKGLAVLGNGFHIVVDTTMHMRMLWIVVMGMPVGMFMDGIVLVRMVVWMVVWMLVMMIR